VNGNREFHVSSLTGIRIFSRHSHAPKSPPKKFFEPRNTRNTRKIQFTVPYVLPPFGVRVSGVFRGLRCFPYWHGF
jgi:hypothetical protein